MLDNPISRNLPLPATVANPVRNAEANLARCLQRLTRFALPLDDPRQRQPDIGLAKAVLDWEPTINLEMGPNTTIDYFRRLLKYISG